MSQSPAAYCKKLDWSDEPFTIKPLPLSLNKSTSDYKSQETSLQVSIFYHTSYYFFLNIEFIFIYLIKWV